MLIDFLTQYLHNHSQKHCFHTYIYLITLSCATFALLLQIIHKKTLHIYFIYLSILHKIKDSLLAILQSMALIHAV
jgi:hypothetical protein